MRKEEMMCPDCTKKDFKVIDQKADDEPSQELEKL
jgi:transcriptional regulator NrdR family protein